MVLVPYAPGNQGLQNPQTKPKAPAAPAAPQMGSAGQVNPAWIYQQLLGQGVSPYDAMALTAIPGRESNYSSLAVANNQQKGGDYWSTGLFQENLGGGYGPNGTTESGPQNIHGASVQAQLGGNAYNDLYGNPLNDIKAAAALVKADGLQPWEKNPNDPNSWQTGIPQNDLTLAAQISQNGGNLPPGYAGLAGNANANLNQNAPGILSDAITKQNDQVQQALNQAMAGINTQFAQQEALYQNQNLGISQTQLGIQRGQLGRLSSEYPALHKLQEEQNNLSLQGMRAGLHDTRQQFAQQYKDMMSQGAGSGTLFTAGHRDDTALAHSQEKSAIATEARSERSLGESEQTQNIQYAEQMAGLKDQKKNLDLLALRYGVSANEIKSRLSNTLQQMGLSAQMTEADLAQQIAQTDVGMGALISGSIAPPLQGVYGIGGGTPQTPAVTPTYPQTPSGG